MSNMFLTAMTGAVAGVVGTGMGGSVAFFIKHPSRRFLSTIMNFSSGLMIAVVTFDLLPQAFDIGGLIWGIVGLILGVGLVVILDSVIPKAIKMDNNELRAGYIKAGLLLGIAIAIHNLPEGLAIGSGFIVYEDYGLALSLIIALHDIPEGVAMAAPMVAGNISKLRIFLGAVLAGVPTGIGAIIGYCLGEISPLFITICLGFAGGAMLYITCGELFPESNKLYRGRIPNLSSIAGIIVGILISAFI